MPIFGWTGHCCSQGKKRLQVFRGEEIQERFQVQSLKKKAVVRAYSVATAKKMCPKLEFPSSSAAIHTMRSDIGREYSAAISQKENFFSCHHPGPIYKCIPLWRRLTGWLGDMEGRFLALLTFDFFPWSNRRQ